MVVAPVAVVANVCELCGRRRLPKLAIAAARGTLEDRSDMGGKESPPLVEMSRMAPVCCSGSLPCDWRRRRYHRRMTRIIRSTRPMPATPPSTPPTTDCCVGERPGPAEPPPEPEEELAEAADPADELVAAAPPPPTYIVLDAVEPPDRKPVSADPAEPNTAVLEDWSEDLVLVCSVLFDRELEVIKFEDVDGMANVPLLYDTSRVEIAVTVTVDSWLVMVPLVVESTVVRLLLVLKDVMVASVESPVVEVSTDCEASSTSVVTAELSVTVEVSTADTVSVPSEDTETRISLVATAIVVASMVVEPTSTLTSTTLDVTVASGARGKR